ncbi:hypothetical protein [Olleya sp. YS]|uniref:hypothetical protein n=1 Tax=Olleya sp. YS TaxID=3028318 RepID=UPI0024345857|nr:hypothetical protein [Olleya sp. YS]WGD35836.1 hypothetical protein Ollyesu_05330 [Olleya sp. YS]
MKKIFTVITLLIVFGCNTQKSGFKLKTISNNHFNIQYPNSWVEFGSFGHFYLTPKAIRKLNNRDELNHISVTLNEIYAEKFTGIDSTLKAHGSTLRNVELHKEYKLLLMPDDSKYIYKIESEITYKSVKGKYKRIEFFIQKTQDLITYYFK